MGSDKKSNFKLAGDIDFISFLFCRIATVLPQGTNLWLAPHSIEKYLKAILEQNNQEIPRGNKGHDLKYLWDESKRHIQSDSNDDMFESMILSLNSLNTGVRYLEHSIFTSWTDTAFYILFATRLRYIIINNQEEYQKLNYGLSDGIILMPNKSDEMKAFLDLHFIDRKTYSPHFGDLKPLQFDPSLNKMYSDYPWLMKGHRKKVTFFVSSEK